MSGKYQLHITPSAALRYIIKRASDKLDESVSAIGRTALERQYSPEIQEVERQIIAGELTIVNGVVTETNGAAPDTGAGHSPNTGGGH